jgi:acyl-CoA synthetase (NDP forming)
VPGLPDVRTEDARALVRGFLRTTLGGGWMPPELAAELLRCYGIPLAASMISGGTEVTVRVTDDHVFGPLVVLGLGAVSSARLTPLTDVDADQLISQIRGEPLLRDTLLRVSRLADDLPEVTELELGPVIARADGVFAVDARIRAAPYRARDPFLRKLR